jgi:hypothetical protein
VAESDGTGAPLPPPADRSEAVTVVSVAPPAGAPMAAAPPRPAPVPRPRGAWDGIALALLAGAAAWLCRPCALHGESLAVLGEGDGVGGGNVAAAATPLADAYRWLVALLEGVGLPVHAAAIAVSAAAAGAAVGCVHAAARAVGATRSEALAAALLAAACPALATAATTVHVHALLLAVAALATWLAFVAARSGSWLATGALAVVLGTAHAAAPAGIVVALAVLPQLVLAAPFAAPERAGAVRRALLQAVVAGAVAAAGVAIARGRLLVGLPTLDELGAYDVATLAPLCAREVGRALLPLSVVLLAMLWARGWHRHVLLLLPALGAVVAVTCHVTATRGDEGAFALPVLPVIAVVAARWLPRRAAFGVALVGLALVAAKVGLRAQWHDADRFAVGVQQVANGRPFLLVTAPLRDDAFALARLPAAPVERVVAVTRAGAPRTAASVVAAWRERVQRGECVLLTADADAALRDPIFRAHHPLAAPLLRALDEAFRLELRHAQGFAGHELVPR